MKKSLLQKQNLSIEWWPTDKPKPYKQNARKISERAIDKVASSLKEFGWRQPIVVNGKGVILAGHTRQLAAKKLGMAQVPVHVAAGLTAAQERAYRLMDNRSASEATWDEELLALELGELKGLDLDLSLTGFDTREIDKLLLSRNPAEDDAPPLPDAPVSRLGDVWLLGKHRLMCGDATKRAAVERLIPSRVDLMFTDPPYGISVVRAASIGGAKPFGKNGFDSVVKAGTYREIIGDDGIETALASIDLFLPLAKVSIVFGGNHFAHRMPPTRCWIVWDKETDGNFGDGEIAWCNAKRSIQIFRHKWSGMLKASERGQKREHPTQKPVALVDWCFAEIAPNSKTVADVFMGSGSTLIACEQTGRQCLGMELSPGYIDVAVTRWQNLTNLEATLEGSGATFAHVKEGRRLEAEDAIKEEVLAGSPR